MNRQSYLREMITLEIASLPDRIRLDRRVKFRTGENKSGPGFYIRQALAAQQKQQQDQIIVIDTSEKK